MFYEKFKYKKLHSKTVFPNLFWFAAPVHGQKNVGGTPSYSILDSNKKRYQFQYVAAPRLGTTVLRRSINKKKNKKFEYTKLRSSNYELFNQQQKLYTIMSTRPIRPKLKISDKQILHFIRSQSRTFHNLSSPARSSSPSHTNRAHTHRHS